MVEIQIYEGCGAEGTQTSQWTERCTDIGISCNQEGLEVWISLETPVIV